jgi:uncharacterized coiled-coil protein SlyX
VAVSFVVDDMEDFVRLLREHPEWREAVRREVLSEELLRLPETAARTERVLARLSGSFDAFRAETNDRLARMDALLAQGAERLARMDELVAQGAARLTRLEETVAENNRLLQAHDRRLTAIDQRMTTMDKRLDRVDGRLGSAEGHQIEQKWESGFAGRFGALVRRARIVTPADLDLFEAADAAETITPAEALGVRQLDLLIQGTVGRGAEERRVLLAVEISTRIEEHDVRRASERARVLRNVGYDAVPVAAGARIDPEIETQARDEGVEVLLRPADLAGE